MQNGHAEFRERHQQQGAGMDGAAERQHWWDGRWRMHAARPDD
jgi:hypothetical protein